MFLASIEQDRDSRATQADTALKVVRKKLRVRDAATIQYALDCLKPVSSPQPEVG